MIENLPLLFAHKLTRVKRSENFTWYNTYNDRKKITIHDERPLQRTILSKCI